MKFYESTYEEYLESIEIYDLHPELDKIFDILPSKISDLGNFIFQGPSGIGKYSQCLKLLRRYSPSKLKHDNRITAQTDKVSYVYHISDIHYEVDMALLGCNSKILWHEIFLQIVDIISVHPDKCGFIVCKNIHMIHDELLQIFYSYIQEYSHPYTPIHIVFIMITEHVSFLPNNIIQSSQIINVRRPSNAQYECIVSKEGNRKVKSVVYKYSFSDNKLQNFTNKISSINENQNVSSKIVSSLGKKTRFILDRIDNCGIMNSKEIKSFHLIDSISELPKDIFNIICDKIVHEIADYNNLSFSGFRDTIYDILVYNLDVSECLFYIFYYFLNMGQLSPENGSEVLDKIYPFLKYYNNNYRPIYHLESIFFFIIMKVHGVKCD
jgi:hypothetical protein